VSLCLLSDKYHETDSNDFITILDSFNSVVMRSLYFIISNNFKASLTEICSNIENKNCNMNETYFNVRLKTGPVVAEIADRTALEMLGVESLKAQSRCTGVKSCTVAFL